MNVPHAPRRRQVAVLAFLAAGLLIAPVLRAADVVTDGDMEAAGIAAWPHTDVTATNSSIKATDQSASGQSLKGTSATGQRVDVEWYNAQTVGTVNVGDTVLLSLWWGARINASAQASAGALYVDVKPASGVWTNVWTTTLNTTTTAFQSGSVTSLDVSASFATSESYDIRLRFVGRTGRDNAANIETWWDDVVLDVTGAAATTTVGNGTDPAGASRCPGDGAADLDAFTLSTSTGADQATAAQVTFAAGTATALSLVEITSDDGATVYGSAANPTDVQSITLTTPIGITTTSTQYRMRVTPKSHAAMPAPPGTTYTVTGTVTDVTVTNTKSLQDTASATVTVDNASPGDATWGTVTPGDGQVALAWTNPGDADFAQVVILRSTASIVAAPAEGTTYTAGNTIGASTVVYAGSGTSFTDTGVTNGTNYWYKIFARDTCVNYALGVQTGPHTPQPPAGDTTTVGNGTDPANASRCPGDGAAGLDAFTLQTSTGADMVTALQVSFAAGTSAGVALVEVTSDNGLTVYGSASNPADTQSISLGTGITATTTLTQYRLRVTPRSHAGMAAPPGASYAVTGTVTAITSTNTAVYDDTTSATVTIDNLSTANPSGFAGAPGDAQVALSWTNPGDGDFAQVIILRSTAAITDAPTEGATYTAGNTIGGTTVVYAGSGTGFTDTGVSNGTAYWYAIFARDGCLNYSTGAQVGPLTPGAAAVDATTVAGSTGTVSSCHQVTIASLYSGDDNGNGTTNVQWNTTNSFPGTTACGTLTGPSPRQCLVTGLDPATQIYVQVDFTDPDGVSGTDPQVLGPFSVPACGGDDAAPTILVVAPRRGTVVGGVDRVKVQVYDAGGLAATTPFRWSVDGGAQSTSVAVNSNYACGADCSIYELDLDTTGLTNGDHYLTVEVTDAGGNVARRDQAFLVNNAGSRAGGGGLLLRRTHGGQLCTDCHALPTHSSQTTSTKYGNWAMGCLNCHTPHQTTNIYLVRESLTTPNSGTKTVLFHFDDASGGTNPGDLPGDNPAQLSFLGDRSGANNTPYDDGICEACHTKTNHWRNDTSGGDHSHNADKRCVECHAHDAGFTGGGGGCLGCHSTGGIAVTAGRRPVEVDFTRQSHHVGNGGTMGGTLTDFDCVVCHAEGAVSNGETVTNPIYHGGDGGSTTIDLKSADDGAVVYSYDKAAVAASAGVAANWHSGDATWRSETSTKLDPFCLTCHDSNGAVTSFNSTDGGSALNPFGDALITNNYDQADRGRVVDIASRVVATTDQDGDGIADPPQGIYSRHAIRGQSQSRYVAYQNITGGNTIWEGDATAGQSLFTNLGTDELGKPEWNDTSVMGCADCHTTDGANGPNGNAHGSPSEYLLKDASGGSTEGTYGSLSYGCYRCHVVGRYQYGGPLGTHTGNASDWVDTTAGVGSANRVTGDGNFFGMACTSCHGGTGFGHIHGTSEVLGVGEDGGAGTRNAYRFMNGANLRFYDPQGWTGTAITCYTLSRNTTPDAFGSCTAHNRGRSWVKPLQRPISY